jgi:hypothetical protein
MNADLRWRSLWLAASLASTACLPRTRAIALPDCSSPDNPTELAWCHGSPPDATAELPAIQGALARMSARGTTCRSRAGLLADLLRRQAVRLYDPESYPLVGAATPADGRHRYLIISRELVRKYYDPAHRSANIDSRGVPRPETLQQVLAHEADHLLGLHHIDADGYLTPNTLQCGDLPG